MTHNIFSVSPHPTFLYVKVDLYFDDPYDLAHFHQSFVRKG